MKNILGLDLGTNSIGWAVITENDDCEEVIAQDVCRSDINLIDLGSRIIPLTPDDSNQFTKGQAITKNSDRTAKRTQRKGYDRYQLRRELLVDKLKSLGIMYGSELVGLRPLELWGLRAKAVTERIDKGQLGRVLCHLNQKRGYKSGKADFADKKQSQWVSAVNDRYKALVDSKQTVGQYLFGGLSSEDGYRCKDQIFPRVAYQEEFDAIMACQKPFYPEILTDGVIDELRNSIIYYQRPLKSCKHLVSVCEFEKRAYKNDKDETVYNGPKVAPRTSPLFQACKIWESINNIVLKNRTGEEMKISAEQKRQLFDFMNCHDVMKLQDMYKILGLSKSDGWWGGKSVGKGLQGNTTLMSIAKALGDYYNADELLRFDMEESESVDKTTGELRRVISPDVEKQPLYKLWHLLYSVDCNEDLNRILWDKFGIEDEAVHERLCKLDFVKAGYGNKSTRAMRRILPYLQDGFNYADACLKVGFRHSESLTISENAERELSEKIELLAKGELRQPIVEKILNQMINLVNALMGEYGRFDEIRIELARELKQSREEREDADKAIRDNERKNKEYAERISEYGLTPTRSRIQKYKMWMESQHICMYCGQPVDITEFLSGFGVEVEHVIPRSLLFDDSFSNKVCACRACNKEKNNRTAYDYMKGKGDAAFQDYVDRVNSYFKEHKIGKAKFEKLLMTAADIPQDFIDRQLRQSQYIATKAREILQTVCRNVYATSGSVTDFIRHTWGWDEVLHQLNFESYRAAGLTEMREVDHNGCKSTEERIKNWSKRMDHRHHAIDALVIACTKQGYIQRINNLNTLRDVPFAELRLQSTGHRERHTLLERYILAQPHFSTAEVVEAVSNIAVSFKSGKRVATLGKRYVHRGGKRVLMQEGLVIPRGALSEESVYGTTKRYEKDKKGRVSSVKQYTIKYPISAVDLKCVKDVVDADIRRRIRERLDVFGGNTAKAYAEPLLDHQGRPIRTVRCFTGLSAVVPVRYDANGEAVGYVKPGNNHHVAVYEDREGGLHEHIVTFWHAVERRKFGIPIIVKHPDEVWDNVTERMSEEFQTQLPKPDWTLRMSMQLNEMFILGMDEDDYKYAVANNDKEMLCRYLYRVQKLATHNYYFRRHIETTVDDKYDGVKNEALSRQMGKLRMVTSIAALFSANPHKVRVSLLGKIEEI